METIFFDFLARRSSFSVPRKRKFQQWTWIFWLVHTIFYIWFQRLLQEKAFFIQWKLDFERILHSGYWRRIFLSNGGRNFTWKFFSTSGNHHFHEWKSIFKDRTYSCRWKLIFWVVETIFFHCLIYLSRSPSSQLVETHFSVQKNSIVFYSKPCFQLMKTIIQII